MNKRNLIPIVCGILFFSGVLALINHTNIEDSQIKIKNDNLYLEKGKSIGRNAMMIYVGRTNKDTIKIEILDLLNLEDSLQNLK